MPRTSSESKENESNIKRMKFRDSFRAKVSYRENVVECIDSTRINWTRRIEDFLHN